mgnify:CR=1 FL=1
MESNCYLVWDQLANEGVVIDPGDSGEYISEEIVREGFDLRSVLLTHGHFDHVLAALEIKLNFGVPIRLNERDEFLYQKAPESAKHWAGVGTGLVAKIDEYIKEGEEIVFGRNRLKVVETPGHTPGSVCFYEKREKMLFTGDLLFADGIGRTDFGYSDPEEMKKSLKKIERLVREGVEIWPGHGESFVS